MKQIKENAIANQKKIIAELRENTSCESSREKAIEKLNLIVDDYEKVQKTETFEHSFRKHLNSVYTFI